MNIYILHNFISRPDCETAIKQILNRTEGTCPICFKKWDWKEGDHLDSSISLHFSRAHRITEKLKFNNNKFSQKNVDSILKICFPYG